MKRLYTDDTKNVQISMDYNGAKSTLAFNYDNRQYNWACITGEFYDWTSCNALGSSAFEFRDIVITDRNGNQASPNWQYTNNIQSCGAQINCQPGSCDIIGQS